MSCMATENVSVSDWGPRKRKIFSTPAFPFSSSFPSFISLHSFSAFSLSLCFCLLFPFLFLGNLNIFPGSTTTMLPHIFQHRSLFRIRNRFPVGGWFIDRLNFWLLRVWLNWFYFCKCFFFHQGTKKPNSSREKTERR